MTISGDCVEHEIYIQAPPEVVFLFFTDPAMHDRWIGQCATLDPRRGGIYRCVITSTATVLGEYLEVEPPRRVVITWGFENNPGIPPGSSTVSITLTADHGGTRVRLVHTGLPHPAIAQHHQGWAGYLAQLAEAAAGSPPGQLCGLEDGLELAEVFAVGASDGDAHQRRRELGESGWLTAVAQRHPG